MSKRVKKLFLLPDLHSPYHDEEAFKLALKVGRVFFGTRPRKDRIVVVMGDFIDCYTISKFPKQHRSTFQEELDSARSCLDDLEGLGAEEMHYLEGNHEARLPKYVAEQAPELFDLMPKMPALLGLDKWHWHPYHDLLKMGKAYLTHDVDGAGPLAHIKASMDVGGNVVIGHTHHAGIHYRGMLKGSAHFGASLGWLGDPMKIDYKNRAKVAHWTQGVGLAYLYPDGAFHLTYCPFIRGAATVEGKLVTLR
jgi:hypothetical protein